MQSHTFTRTRGVNVYVNGSTSHHRLHDVQQPSTSRYIPRSISHTPGLRNGHTQRSRDPTLPPTFVARFHDELSVRRMSYRHLPGTDMVVSKMGLGCSAIGGMFANITDSTTQIVETALRSGVNLIDTAYWYGQSRSEAILGKILAKVPRSAYYICTKNTWKKNPTFGYAPGKRAQAKKRPVRGQTAREVRVWLEVGRFELDYARTFDFRADRILESLTTSLKKLQLTYVDICFVQIHDADFAPNESILLYETLQALEMAKASGKIRYIGLTGYPLKKIASIVDVTTVKINVIMSYCHATLNDNSLGEYVQYFKSKGVGLINASPLSMGLLTDEGPPPWHPANDLIKESCLAASIYAKSKNISISKLALEYSFNFPGCSSCFTAMDSVQQVRENFEICNGLGLSDVEQRLRDRIMRRYLDRLDNAGWEGVDVAQYWKRLKKLGLTALATNRHSSVESLASTLNGLSFYSPGSSLELRMTPKRTFRN